MALNHIIIGAGAAGLSCAETIRARDKAATITLIGKEEQYPYNRPMLSALIGDGLSIKDIVMEAPEYYQASAISMRYDTTVVSVDTIQKTVTLSSGEVLPYDKLCLAQGANPFNPYRNAPLPVYTLRTYHDAEQILHALKGKRVFIVGGGILGLEIAMALHKQHATVTMADRNPYPLSLQVDALAGTLLKHDLALHGIGFIASTGIRSIEADGVILDNGEKHPCDAVIASIGVRSETALAKQMGLAVSRGIVVNERCETSLPDIYAAGDCAEYLSVAGGQWAIALKQGEIAGAQMAGDDKAVYTPDTPAMLFNANHFSVLSLGKVNGDALDKMTFYSPTRKEYRLLTFQDGCLCGTLLLGDISRADKALRLIALGADKVQAASALL